MIPPAWLVPRPLITGTYRNDREDDLSAHLLLRDGDQCSVCHAPLTGGQIDIRGCNLQLDHIIPKRHGGGEGIENKQLIHGKCNIHKSGQLYDELVTQVERNRHYYDVLLSRPDLLDPRCTIWADNDA